MAESQSPDEEEVIDELISAMLLAHLDPQAPRRSPEELSGTPLRQVIRRLADWGASPATILRLVRTHRAASAADVVPALAEELGLDRRQLDRALREAGTPPAIRVWLLGLPPS